MAWLADAHREWHTVNGWNDCPLDCYEVEARREAEYEAQAAQDAAVLATTVGTLIHGTLRLQDLAPAFLRILESVAPWIIGTDWHVEMSADVDAIVSADVEPDNAYDIVIRLEDEINGALPDGYRFGPHEGDGADFGIWETEPEDVDADA